MKLVDITHQGQEQSIQLPADCRLETTQVYVKRVGKAVLLIPRDEDPWQMFTQSLDEFTDDFMHDRDQPSALDRRVAFE